MGWRVHWRITCDRDQCGAVGPLATDSSTAEERAVLLGWIAVWAPLYRGGAAHLCPGCAGKERPAWWPVTEEE